MVENLTYSVFCATLTGVIRNLHPMDGGYTPLFISKIETLGPNGKLADDLGFDSLSIWPVVMGVEESYDIDLSVEFVSEVHTLGDFHLAVCNAMNNKSLV